LMKNASFVSACIFKVQYALVSANKKF